MKKLHFLLLVIIFLSLFLRIYQLGEVPNGFHRDEAFLGYNAYSLSKTAKDMNGNFLPLHLQSFLYTPAGYSYFVIPFVSPFGLNEFSVRLPSALFGGLTVILVFILVLEIFKLKEWNYLKGNTKIYIALLASFFLSVSPWHINLSRTASVITLVVFFITLGIIIYFFWLRKRKVIFLFLSFVSFFISLSFYIAPYSFLVLFVPFMILILAKDYMKINKLSIILYLILIVLPLILTFKSSDLSLRARSLSIFNHEAAKLVVDEQIREDGVKNVFNLQTRFFHNKLNEYSRIISRNYFSHLSYDFLFSDKGFPDRYRIPLMGLLYIFDLPFLILGIKFLLDKNKRIAILLLAWVLIGPIGSSFSADDVPNMQRILLIFPAIPIISAFGVFYMFDLVNKYKKIQKLAFVFVSLFFVFSFIFYIHQYYIHGPQYRSWYRQYGYKLLVAKVNKEMHSYKKAVITNRESAPTIFFLFYENYDPKLFQEETKNSILKDFDRVGFGKYEFTEEECPLRLEKDGEKNKIVGEKNILYVNGGLCAPVPESREISVVKRTDNSVAFRILSLNN